MLLTLVSPGSSVVHSHVKENKVYHRDVHSQELTQSPACFANLSQTLALLACAWGPPCPLLCFPQCPSCAEGDCSARTKFKTRPAGTIVLLSFQAKKITDEIEIRISRGNIITCSEETCTKASIKPE